MTLRLAQQQSRKSRPLRDTPPSPSSNILTPRTCGSPANLERYCHPTLLQWYEKQNVTVQEAKAQMAEFDR
jgi:hypothetical protein